MVMVFALAAALLYGSADFLGGAATRRAHVLSVLLVSCSAGMVVLLAGALLAGGRPQPAGLAWGIAAGASGGVGFMFFYAALAAGPMTVVAPLSALVSTVLPVASAVAMGERPGPGVYVGALLCSGGSGPAPEAPQPAAGVTGRAGTPARDRARTARGIGWGIASGAAFG